ncbi:MAG TPA: hypothetical protein VFT43_10805, partial [Candidatus Polarisedimenticolia bacterium]|nr:hypothetical protein [Candidatus Polarisedimenticolia bacterium]
LAMERLAGAASQPVGAALPGAEGATRRPRQPPRAATSGAGAPTPPEDAEMQALLSDIEGHPRRESGDDGLSDERRRELADARRFAHLLVSELLLYNEEAVVQGRRHRDLYQRLQKEIDRSRQAYQARLSGRQTGASDYFDEELVRLLAQGDPSLLGS